LLGNIGRFEKTASAKNEGGGGGARAARKRGGCPRGGNLGPTGWDNKRIKGKKKIREKTNIQDGGWVQKWEGLKSLALQ